MRIGKLDLFTCRDTALEWGFLRVARDKLCLAPLIAEWMNVSAQEMPANCSALSELHSRACSLLLFSLLAWLILVCSSGLKIPVVSSDNNSRRSGLTTSYISIFLCIPKPSSCQNQDWKYIVKAGAVLHSTFFTLASYQRRFGLWWVVKWGGFALASSPSDKQPPCSFLLCTSARGYLVLILFLSKFSPFCQYFCLYFMYIFLCFYVLSWVQCKSFVSWETSGSIFIQSLYRLQPFW